MHKGKENWKCRQEIARWRGSIARDGTEEWLHGASATDLVPGGWRRAWNALVRLVHGCNLGPRMFFVSLNAPLLLVGRVRWLVLRPVVLRPVG